MSCSVHEVHPSVEYADDILPLFSDRWAAIYRLSCIVAGLWLLGGVRLNSGKLAMLSVQWLQKVRVTAAQVEAYARSRGTWLSCKFCGLHMPDMVALREHQSSRLLTSSQASGHGKPWWPRRW